MTHPVLQDFDRIIARLKEVLQKEKNDISRDSSIKRFELCFDLAWRAIKVFSKEKGVECYSPTDCFKSGYQLKLIDNEAAWLEMVKARNETVHVYKEAKAEEVYAHLSKYVPLFEELLKKLKQ